MIRPRLMLRMRQTLLLLLHQLLLLLLLRLLLYCCLAAAQLLLLSRRRRRCCCCSADATIFVLSNVPKKSAQFDGNRFSSQKKRGQTVKKNKEPRKPKKSIGAPIPINYTRAQRKSLPEHIILCGGLLQAFATLPVAKKRTATRSDPVHI